MKKDSRLFSNSGRLDHSPLSFTGRKFFSAKCKEQVFDDEDLQSLPDCKKCWRNAEATIKLFIYKRSFLLWTYIAI